MTPLTLALTIAGLVCMAWVIAYARDQYGLGLAFVLWLLSLFIIATGMVLWAEPALAEQPSRIEVQPRFSPHSLNPQGLYESPFSIQPRGPQPHDHAKQAYPQLPLPDQSQAAPFGRGSVRGGESSSLPALP